MIRSVHEELAGLAGDEQAYLAARREERRDQPAPLDGGESRRRWR